MNRAPVMVVEDDFDVREAVAIALEDNGYETILASNGREALDELRRAPRRPFVILLDVMMPVMDGTQFRREQQKDPTIAWIPVVIVTAIGNAAQKAAEMNAASALQKPVGLDDLLRTVERFANERSSEP